MLCLLTVRERQLLEGSILLKWIIWHVTFFFACRAQDYECDKVHVCYWYRLSMHLSTEKVQATCSVFKYFQNPYFWRNVYL